ncbi:hypothetical protein D1224_15680 [Henriciella barbarensis]|uniref:Uncharacterized protein n=1 Tax=Henriciella barbarensis TaxID=86342 RepID=A0A399QSK4_9PROT|nr:hypothetical protein [Henriciella barbarensis]RIJ20549.1 hypothetical protein D1224_15680 [Henriciella barbarensis]
MMPRYTLSQLTSDGLPHTMAYLVAAAQEHATITYGQIAEKLEHDLKIEGRIFSTQIGHPVGALMERILESFPDAPLLNLLAVNQSSGIASGGADQFLAARYNKRLSQIQRSESLRQDLINRALAEVYAFEEWDAIAETLFGTSLPDTARTAPETGTEIDRSTSPGQPRGGDAESPEHKALKERIIANPALVDAKPSWLKPEPEVSLKSGDVVDVCIIGKAEIRLVEVKSRRSNEHDLERGIYQCVKYRAVYEAMREANGIETNVVVVLAIEQPLPSRLKPLARKLGVTVKIVQ